MPNSPVGRHFTLEICEYFVYVKRCIWLQHFLAFSAYTHYFIHPGELHSWRDRYICVLFTLKLRFKNPLPCVFSFKKASVHPGPCLTRPQNITTCISIWQCISDGACVSSRVTGDLLSRRKWNLCRYMKLDMSHSVAFSLPLQFLSIWPLFQHYISICTEANHSATKTYALIFILDALCRLIKLNTSYYPHIATLNRTTISREVKRVSKFLAKISFSS